MSKDDKPTKLEPRLRFPEFKGGPGWDTPAMSDLYGFRSTKSLSRDQLNYDAGSIYNIHYGDIHTKFQTQFLLENEHVPFIDPAVAEELGDRFYLCREGDIILADASEDLNDVGKAIELISLCGHRVVAGTHTIHATRLDQNPVVGFGGYLFKSAGVRRGIHKEAQGAKVYGISSNRIAAVRLPLPQTTDEQRKIAECLGSLDDWIAAETEALEILRRHKTGLMQQLFPRPGETQPRLRFPEFEGAGEWVEKTISGLGEVITGSTPSTTRSEYYGGDRQFVSPADISELRFIRETKTTLTELGFQQTRPIKAKSVLFVCIGSTIGKVAQNLKDCATNQQINSVIPGPGTSTDFLYYLLSECSERIAEIAGNQAVPIINKSLFSGFKVLCPKEDEQQRIADSLTALDARVEAQTAKIETLKQHKRGLMQQLFPGPDAADGGR